MNSLLKPGLIREVSFRLSSMTLLPWLKLLSHIISFSALDSACFSLNTSFTNVLRGRICHTVTLPLNIRLQFTFSNSLFSFLSGLFLSLEHPSHFLQKTISYLCLLHSWSFSIFLVESTFSACRTWRVFCISWILCSRVSETTRSPYYSICSSSSILSS